MSLRGAQENGLKGARDGRAGRRTSRLTGEREGARRSVKAIILAGGYATRLYPLTLSIPKPLLKITAARAVIDFIVEDLEKSGLVDEIIVVTNSKFFKDFCRWAKRVRRKIRLVVLDDGTHSNEDRLGAVGDIAFAVHKKKIRSDLLVIGGDNLFEKGFGGFLTYAGDRRPCTSLGLFDIGNKTEATRFGVVALDRTGRIISFEEKPLRPKSTLVATCLYYFPSETLKLLKRYMADEALSKDASGNYIRWLAMHGPVYGFALKKGHWVDIGHLDSYKEVVARYNK